MKNRNLAQSDNWGTPLDFYKELDKEYNFDFDPCPLNHDINKWDGLEIEWGKRNFINPPYRRNLKEAFVKKAISESKKGKLCVMLLPVSTSTKLFHDFILPNKTKIKFIKGRIHFIGINTFGELVTNKAGMHDSMIVVFDGRQGIGKTIEESAARLLDSVNELFDIPIVGKEYNYFDNGVYCSNRMYKVKIKEVIPFKDASKELKETFKDKSEYSPKVYNNKTDYFVTATLVDNSDYLNKNIEICFVRGAYDIKWFSLDEEWAGELDVDGSITK